MGCRASSLMAWDRRGDVRVHRHSDGEERPNVDVRDFSGDLGTHPDSSAGVPDGPCGRAWRLSSGNEAAGLAGRGMAGDAGDLVDVHGRLAQACSVQAVPERARERMLAGNRFQVSYAAVLDVHRGTRLRDEGAACSSSQACQCTPVI
jgi:hypothetical protein